MTTQAKRDNSDSPRILPGRVRGCDGAIKRAIWMVSAPTHRGKKPGDVQELNGLHDHRFTPGMSGMGIMLKGHEHGTHGGHSVLK
jgi:hypothetical protein